MLVTSVTSPDELDDDVLRDGILLFPAFDAAAEYAAWDHATKERILRRLQLTGRESVARLH